VDDADRCHIAAHVAAKHQDRIVHQLRDVGFAVDRIERHVIGVIQHRLGTLNDPDGRFSAFCSAAEEQNRLCERIGRSDFVMERVHGYIVAGAGLQCFLTLDHASGERSSIRQPGEYRDPRIAHSVRRQNFLPFRIKSNSA